MTPGARVQAAIEVLDQVLAGSAAERELTAWARGSRYAGSRDRAAVRDHVFDALRRLRSSAWAGGLGDVPMEQMTGRAVMAGLLSGQGEDLGQLFTGEGHAPAPLSEMPAPGRAPDTVALDCPDWLWPLAQASLGDGATAIFEALRDRAPVTLRANSARVTRAALIARLAGEGVEATPHPLSQTAVIVTGKTRGLTLLDSFVDGLFELQDAGSQALVDRVPAASGEAILDLCAGGGGKALALAARVDADISVHDIDAARMRDVPTRAERAGARIKVLTTLDRKTRFDGVVADVPCSGSGSWRRAPEAKWRLTPARLQELTALQAQILDRAIDLTKPGGWTAYMTCSLLAGENADIVDAVLSRRGDVSLVQRWQCSPLDGADGFHLSVLRRN
ncbi:RsmB/NOP family class I SAM-dependent RNA methyltransferase [Jannaschia sp. 2305UL9-9]|uniref:RsmB/NOP family class I SAM-dependent RNA methyltransferase n=1 Tax=Jannaschia sp. 2305UL9-9 TaxID=3121638 RepID=UPI0035298094